MPTYVCSTAAGRLTPTQKTDIVRCITTVHHEEVDAPRYLVQVIFCEVASGNHYIAGEPARPDQIWIRGDLRGGRTEEQKGKILRRILQGVAKFAAAAAEEAVWVYLSDIPATNISEYGRILPLPERRLPGLPDYQNL
jgi:phenylpyruvate tautomerase PptA (4-oxalocrotonate tautomerase family)